MHMKHIPSQGSSAAFSQRTATAKSFVVIAAMSLFLSVPVLVVAQTENNPGGETMQTVTSKDGTIIAFDKLGQGDPLILVSGALGSRSQFSPLAELLAKRFTVYNYDRRGRGDSGDTQPYAVEREIEDIEAVIDAAGGSAFVYGFPRVQCSRSRPRVSSPPKSRSWHCTNHPSSSMTAVHLCQKIM
jgi:hypothetical protein